MNIKTNCLEVNDFLVNEAINLCKEGISIAVDFDSTLCLTDGYPNILGPNGDCFWILHKWQDMGCKILLHTMRHGKDLEEARVWCANCKFFFDGVNHNPENEARDPEYNEKMYAMFYIDDKAFGTPLLHDTTGKIKDHVDCETIDRIYTPFLTELIKRIKERQNEYA